MSAASLPPRQPGQAQYEPYVDGCPNCVNAYNRPLSIAEEPGRPDAVRCQYRCAVCLWSWRTGYGKYRPEVC